jgi:L-threonylcarbamoyladenylate synthase
VTPVTAQVVAASDDAIALAARLIRRGDVVAFPTETVYGLGADASNGEAVARIFAAKNRPEFNPLIVHVADRAAAETHVAFTSDARRLADRFWPGPLTMVLPRRKDSAVSLLATAGLDTMAIRVPAHPVAQALIAAAKLPIAAPSANRSGEVSPTTAAHVLRSLGEHIGLVIDGGPCQVGVESTVLDLTTAKPTILRPGGVTEEEIARVIGGVGRASDDAAIKSPGMLESHYAPRVPLRLNATSIAPREALIAFGPAPITGVLTVRNLSPSGDLVEAAANLFAMMRDLDRPEHTSIAVMPIPETGLGRAINDRLRRAAAPRPLGRPVANGKPVR